MVGRIDDFDPDDILRDIDDYEDIEDGEIDEISEIDFENNKSLDIDAEDEDLTD